MTHQTHHSPDYAQAEQNAAIVLLDRAHDHYHHARNAIALARVFRWIGSRAKAAEMLNAASDHRGIVQEDRRIAHFLLGE